MTFRQIEWPAERVANLKEFHAAGDYASVIATKLSTIEGITITRNAVIGKVDRLGLSARPKVKKTEAELQAARERRRERQNELQRVRRSSSVAYINFKQSSRAEKKTVRDASELPPLNLTLHDLTMRDGRPVECRFITNDDMANATYCGHPVDTETSWCPHHRLKLQPPKNWLGPKYTPSIVCAA